MKNEELVETLHEELIEASNKNDNSKVIDLSREVTKYEKEIEENFEELEVTQTKLDDILEEYESKLEGL